MRYAKIRKTDIANGDGIGVALFVQGCHLHCNGCFNPETWDFSGGEEWTEETKQKFLEIISPPYINRISILGGEPLSYENLPEVYELVKDIKRHFPYKKIWLYTGYELMFNDFEDRDTGFDNAALRNCIIRKCDVIVDGEFKEEKKSPMLKFKGSSNQRIIDVKKSLNQKKIVLKDV